MSEEHTWLRQTAWNKKDEYYTPRILVEPILPFIPVEWKVWCPFDTARSEFVLCLEERGNVVVRGHLADGNDFFDYEPDEYDCIVSNPPFTKKLDVFRRLYGLGKPFAMVMGLPILNYQEVGNFFLGRELQLLIVDKKVSFDGNTASFNNSFFCWNLLPRDLMFTHLEHNNSRANFVGSEMGKDLEVTEEKPSRVATLFQDQ